MKNLRYLLYTIFVFIVFGCINDDPCKDNPKYIAISPCHIPTFNKIFYETNFSLSDSWGFALTEDRTILIGGFTPNYTMQIAVIGKDSADISIKEYNILGENKGLISGITKSLSPSQTGDWYTVLVVNRDQNNFFIFTVDNNGEKVEGVGTENDDFASELNPLLAPNERELKLNGINSIEGIGYVITGSVLDIGSNPTTRFPYTCIIDENLNTISRFNSQGISINPGDIVSSTNSIATYQGNLIISGYKNSNVLFHKADPLSSSTSSENLNLISSSPNKIHDIINHPSKNESYIYIGEEKNVNNGTDDYVIREFDINTLSPIMNGIDISGGRNSSNDGAFKGTVDRNGKILAAFIDTRNSSKPLSMLILPEDSYLYGDYDSSKEEYRYFTSEFDEIPFGIGQLPVYDYGYVIASMVPNDNGTYSVRIIKTDEDGQIAN